MFIIFEPLYKFVMPGFNAYQACMTLAITSLIVMVPLWIAAAIEDYKFHYVYDAICGAILLCNLIIGTLLCGIFVAPVVLVAAYFVFRKKELPLFGQADFLPFVQLACNYGFESPNMTMCIVQGVMWLLCLIVHIITYKDDKGRRYKPFSGMMIPALPSFAVAYAITTILRVAFSKTLFFMGVA